MSDKVSELAKKLSGIAIVSSDIKDGDLAGQEIDVISNVAIAYFEDKQGLKVLDKTILDELIKEHFEEKMPIQIEIIRSSDFKPIAKEIADNFSVKNKEVEKITGNTDSFVEYFQDRFAKLSDIITRNRTLSGLINKISMIKEYANGREISVLGIVSDKIITKKGHVLVTLEDESGVAKVLFLKSESRQSADLFDAATKIIYDDVVAIKGKVSSPFIIANSVLYPDIPVRSRKTTEEDFAIAFLSDTHIGSKLFQEKSFTTMLKWLNNGIDYRKDLLNKIKYIVVSGDLVDGIGVYPNQDRDLEVLDIYKQYSILFDFLRNIPDYIHVFVLPGNHDAVHRAEPQPIIGPELMGEIKESNIHLVSNPSYIKIHGINILAYHGASLNSIIRYVPGCNFNRPETAMVEALKRRHLSPIYGGNMVIPAKKDTLVIDEVPDILNMGHLHKNGSLDYHGTLVLNSGTWQGRTEYQAKQGYLPTPGIMPIYEPKKMVLNNIDFNVL